MSFMILLQTKSKSSRAKSNFEHRWIGQSDQESDFGLPLGVPSSLFRIAPKITVNGYCMETNALNTALVSKQLRRHTLARLPMKEKLDAVIQLQRLAAPILKRRGIIRRVWTF